MKKIIYCCILLLAVNFTMQAQETTVDGFVMPRKTTAQRTNTANFPLTTPKGIQVYDTDTQSLWYWDGTVWVENASSANSDFTEDAWVNDVLNTMVHLGTLSDGTTARPTSTEFVVLDNGNVGIGTLTPDVNLHINGKVKVTNGNVKVKDGNLLVINGNGQFKSPKNQVRVVDTDDSNRTWSLNANNSLLGIRDITNGTTPFIIYSNAPTNSLRIGANGNIGVGTSTPSESLDVNGKIQAVDVNFSGLPIFLNEAAAATLTTGDMYRTPTGELRIKL